MDDRWSRSQATALRRAAPDENGIDALLEPARHLSSAPPSSHPSHPLSAIPASQSEGCSPPRQWELRPPSGVRWDSRSPLPPVANDRKPDPDHVLSANQLAHHMGGCSSRFGTAQHLPSQAPEGYADAYALLTLNHRSLSSLSITNNLITPFS